MSKTKATKTMTPAQRKRHLVALIRKFGLAGAQDVFAREGYGYVSIVTLWKIKKAAGIEVPKGRPTLKLTAKRERLAAAVLAA